MANQPIINPPTPIAIGSPVQGGTPGNLLIINGDGTLGQEAASFNYLPLTGGTLTGKLTISDSTDANPIVVTSSLAGVCSIKVTNSNAANGESAFESATDVGNVGFLSYPGSNNPAANFGLGGASRFHIYSSDGGFAIIADGSDYPGIYLATQGTASANIRAKFDATSYIVSPLAFGAVGATPDASALLDMQSTTLGFGPPAMTTVQKAAISSPRDGLVVYDTTLHKLCVYSTGTSTWQTVTSA